MNAGTDVVSSDCVYMPVKLPSVKDIAELIVQEYFYQYGRHKDVSSRQPFFTENKFKGLMSDKRVAFDQCCLYRDDDDRGNISCSHFNSASPVIHLTDERVGSVDRMDDDREFLDNIDFGCLNSFRSFKSHKEILRGGSAIQVCWLAMIYRCIM